VDQFTPNSIGFIFRYFVRVFESNTFKQTNFQNDKHYQEERRAKLLSLRTIVSYRLSEISDYYANIASFIHKGWGYGRDIGDAKPADWRKSPRSSLPEVPTAPDGALSILERVHKKCHRFFGSNARPTKNLDCIFDSTKSKRSISEIVKYENPENAKRISMFIYYSQIVRDRLDKSIFKSSNSDTQKPILPMVSDIELARHIFDLLALTQICDSLYSNVRLQQNTIPPLADDIALRRKWVADFKLQGYWYEIFIKSSWPPVFLDDF